MKIDIMNIIIGIVILLIMWILAEQKEHSCSFLEAFRLVTESLNRLFAKPEQTIYIYNDPDFILEMESIQSRYSSIPTEYTYSYCNKSDLPFYVSQFSCSENDKPVVEHLIKIAVRSSLLRSNINSAVSLEWIQYDGVPAVKAVYASTKEEHEIFSRRISQMKHSMSGSPIIDEDLEQELKENDC